MPVPILTGTMIDRVMREQRIQLRPRTGWGYSALPMRAVQALDTLTADGWCWVAEAAAVVVLPTCLTYP